MCVIKGESVMVHVCDKGRECDGGGQVSGRHDSMCGWSKREEGTERVKEQRVSG